MDNSSVTHIAGRAPTLTFVLEEPFESALTTLRRAFAQNQLCVAVELDAAKRIRRALSITVSPCRILFVENPLVMLEATAVDRSSAVFIPLHIVVSGGGRSTLVHVLRFDRSQLFDFPIGLRAALMSMQDHVLRTLGKLTDQTRGVNDPADRGEGHAQQVDGQDVV